MKHTIKNTSPLAMVFVSLTLLSAILLSGCAPGVTVPTKKVLAAVISGYSSLPDIRVCHSDATESEEYYLDDALLLSLFGKNGEAPDFSAVEECSIFISKGQQIVEFAVFKSYTLASTKDIVRMCQERLAILKRADSNCTGEVFSLGHYVIYTNLADNEPAKKICKQMLS